MSQSRRTRRRWARAAAKSERRHDPARELAGRPAGASASPDKPFGKTLHSVPGLPSHLSVRVVAARDGALVCARCDACGGRYDCLIDVDGGGAGHGPGTYGLNSGHGDACASEQRAERLARRLTAAVDALADGPWIDAHRACASQPQEHLLPDAVEAFLAELQSSL